MDAPDSPIKTQHDPAVGKTIFARALRAGAGLICRHPRLFVWPQLALFAACVFYTVFFLKFDMNQDNMVGSEEKEHRAYLQFRKEFPGEDELAVVVESEDMDRNRQFVERLAARLAPETNLFTDIFYKGDLPSLGSKALLFVPDADLKKMQEKLEQFRPFIEQFTHASNFDSFFGLINRQIRTAKEEENATNNALMGALPALQRIVDEAADSLSRPGTPVSPGVTALFGAGGEAQQRMYITFANGRIYLVTARPRDSDTIPEAIQRMRELMRETEIEVPGLNVGLTGSPVLDYDQMLQSKSDMTLATIVSLVLCSLIFIYAYREARRPLKAMLCLVVGLGYSMAFATLAVGHLNILTVNFAPILIGLAIDFGIHFITRFEEEIRRHRTPEQAVETAMIFTGQGIITGALTTSAAFLAMGMTHFKGIQEMGIIAGGGLALCLFPMMTMLPALLLRGKRDALEHAVGLAAEGRARLEGMWLKRPGLVVGGTVALCAVAATQFHKVFFDYNLLNMQSKGLPAVVYEKKLLFSGALTFSTDDITNLPALVKKLDGKQDQVSAFIDEHLDLQGKTLLDSYQGTNSDSDELESALVKNLNRIITGPLVYTPMRFSSVALRPETAQLLKTQPKGQELIRLNQMLLQDAYPHELTPRSGQSILYAAIVADTLQQAADFEREVTNLPAVASVDGSDRGDAMFALLTKDPTADLAMVRHIKSEVSDFHFAPVDTNAVALHELSLTLYGTIGYLLNAVADPSVQARPQLKAELQGLADSISDLRVKMLSADLGVPERLQGYQEALFRDIRQTFEAIQTQDASSPLRPQDLPTALRSRFVGKTGKFMVQVFPKDDVWQHENQKEFISELQKGLDGQSDRVTGMPLELYEYTTLLKVSYQQAALYALIVIAFMVYLHFRSVACVILSLLPVAVGSAWGLGLMGLAGVPFNPANIMTLPLVIGIGVTNGIHILNRVAEEEHASILGKSTGKAVLVSGLTALTGFGSLMLAKHQGIQSLGLVMSAGIGACLVAGLTFLPALISILVRNGWSVSPKRLGGGQDKTKPPPSTEEPR
ncbi:MAG TPA: MMPL family transporter [Verrucomicrobiae bacterium]